MRKLWFAFTAVMVVSFLVLGWVGTRIYQEMPPIPDKVVTTDWIDADRQRRDHAQVKTCGKRWAGWKSARFGATVATSHPTGPPIGCIAKPFSFSISWANDEFGKPFEELDEEYQGQLTARLTNEFHANNYDAGTGTLTIDPLRAEAFAANVEHYRTVFIDGNADYAIPAGAISE